MRSIPLLAWFVPAALAAACGRNSPAPVTPANAAPTGAPETSAPPRPVERIDVLVGGMPWTVAVADGTVSQPDEYVTLVTTPSFVLDLTEWPQSDAFVQTLDEHLEGMRQTDPAAEVLHQVDGGRYAFEAVVRASGKIDGVVLVNGGYTGGMCGFELPDGADWHAPLAACQSLAPAEPVEHPVDAAP